MSGEKWFIEHFESEGTAFGLRLEKKLESKQTQFQHIEIWQTETFGYLMTIDGCTMVTSRDNFLYHEMMVHPALFAHACPARVAIIGGGDCGTLREVLRHDETRQVWQVDIDSVVTELSRKYFPELCESNDDPRAELVFEDGVQWIRNHAAKGLDVIIVDSTDPVGPAEGLFRREFFEDCLRALDEGGILVQQSESPLLHGESIIRGMHENMREAGFSSTQTLHFPVPTYPSGWWSCTLAGAQTDVTRFRETDAGNRDFSTEYYTPAVHQGAMELPPFLVRAIGQGRSKR